MGKTTNPEDLTPEDRYIWAKRGLAGAHKSVTKWDQEFEKARRKLQDEACVDTEPGDCDEAA